MWNFQAFFPLHNALMRSVAFALLVLAPAIARAQTPAPQPKISLPPVTVTAQKEPADPQSLPVSLTAVPLDSLWNGGMASLGDLSIYAPNTYYSDFTARKLSNPRFRGIGSSPANPSVTTFIDGVPQLNANSSSIELLDVRQVEFVRGPQSALFGRNTLGGLVNVTSVRPSLSKWTGSAIVPFGNYAAFDVRANASGPVGSKAAVGFAIGHSQRDGFTKNDVSGKDIDYRDATFGKAQLLLTPTATWEARLIYTGEHARDGDYALMDLQSLRDNPLHAARDFEGNTDRDINAFTALARHEGQRFTFSSTTGFVNWKTLDKTDLDYTPLPIVTRSNDEQALQFTQEFRFASAPAAAMTLSDSATLKWQAGVFLFTQNYDQDAVNTYSPFVLSPFINIPVDQHAPVGSLDDTGVGVYGNGTFVFGNNVDVTVGARVDHENKKADLSTYLSGPTILSIPQVVNDEKGYSNAAPQAAVSFRFKPDALAYFSVTGGYKAGGWNPTSPQGNEAYDQEKTWNYEGGVKTGAGRPSRHRQFRRVHHRLGRPAAEPAEPAGAGAVLHLQHRQRAQHRLRGRTECPGARGGESLRDRRLHARALWCEHLIERRGRVGQQGSEHTGLHDVVRRGPVASDLERAPPVWTRRRGVLRRLQL